MAKMKKAFLLSSSAVLLVFIIVISFGLGRETQISKSRLEATAVRVQILNDFVNSLESSYFERILYVAGKSALNSIAEYKLSGNSFPTQDGFNKDFTNVLVNGTIRKSGSSYGRIDGQMQEKSLMFFIDGIREIFNYSGIEISRMEVQIIEIKHDSPWTVEVHARFRYGIQDKNRIAGWDGFADKRVSISIIGIDDPSGEGAIFTSNAPDRWIGHLPAQSASNGDSFLKRLSGDASLNLYGICRQNNQNCGSCGNGCGALGKSCEAGPGNGYIGNCIP